MSEHAPESDLSQRLVDIAVEAVHPAAEQLRDHWGAPPGVSTKSSAHDLVTDVDQRVEAMIAEALVAGWPDSTVEGEEGGVQGSGSVRWLVDPIDGTANFVHGIPFFCTSVAAVVDGHPLAAVVADPVRGDLFVASTSGATLNGKPLGQASTAESWSDAVLLTAFPYEGKLATDGELAAYQELVRTFGAIRRLGSIALELAYVAAGRAQVAFELRTKPWDVAAGMFLVEQAGGSYAPGSHLPDQQDRHEARSFLACQPGFDRRHPALDWLLASSAL